MPIHEYQCPKCGHKLEKIELVALVDWPQCPNDNQQMQRLISKPAAPQFKGDGWTAKG